MAEVRLTNVYVPTPFNQGIQEAQTENDVFLNAGIVAVDPRINTMATTGGKTGVMPEFMPLTFDEPGYSTDNPANTSTSCEYL